MKLINKFNDVKYNEYGIDNHQCEKIADDFAIGFAEWLMENCTLAEDNSLWSYESEDYTNEKLLEIYKKEKGL